MSAERNKEIIRSLYAALGAGDHETFLAGFAEDVQWTIIGSTALSKTFDGKKALVDELLGPFGEKIDGAFALHPSNFIAEGDFVVMESRGESRTIYDKDYNNTYCHVFRLSEGKVRQVTEYLDTELLSDAFQLRA